MNRRAQYFYFLNRKQESAPGPEEIIPGSSTTAEETQKRYLLLMEFSPLPGCCQLTEIYSRRKG